jgi:D-sedoheptulose 7-phosphate isomerase
MKTLVHSLLEEAQQVKAKAVADQQLQSAFVAAVHLTQACIAAGGTIYSCGNGGSACDAMHLTEELVARFKRERPGIRAMHFLDGASLTCWANDYDFESVFERQAQTFCRKGDVLFGFSTSGNSKNVLRAIKAANKNGASTIALTGQSGGLIKSEATECVCVPSTSTERIQEVHITLVHVLLEILERPS